MSDNDVVAKSEKVGVVIAKHLEEIYNQSFMQLCRYKSSKTVLKIGRKSFCACACL
jgi:hypothetical protein